MASFTTRVELHDAVYPADYDTLHAAMKEQGFSRSINASNGKRYYLPMAEYNKVGDFTRQQVLNSAKQAASTTKREFSILVTESVEAGRVWYKLDEVKLALKK